MLNHSYLVQLNSELSSKSIQPGMQMHSLLVAVISSLTKTNQMNDIAFVTYLEFSNNWDRASELLVDHKSKNSHHGGTSVVELDGTLGKLGLFIEGVPSEVKSSVAEVTRELALSGNILHYEKLKSSNEGNNLQKSSLGDGVDGGPTVGDGVEAGSRVVNVSGKLDSVTGHDLSKESKLGDTSVLELDITKTVEFLLVGIGQKSQRIEESKRRLDSKLRLEGHVQGSGGLGHGRGSEGGGGTGKNGGDGELHVGLVCLALKEFD